MTRSTNPKPDNANDASWVPYLALISIGIGIIAGIIDTINR